MPEKVNVIIEKDEIGFVAYCPDLEGCHCRGDTLEEVISNIKEAVKSYNNEKRQNDF